MTSRLALVMVLVPALLAAQGSRPVRGTTYDRVILGGRVMDPASGLDAARNLGINGKRIAILTAAAITGRDTIDARGLVVAPGFIDLHAHGQNDESYGYYARDGVTTALEMEIGIGPVQQFYAEREGKARVNFGGAAAHLYARRVALGQPLADFSVERRTDTATAWSHTPTTPAILQSVTMELARELDAGALGVGLGIAYTPGASRLEIFRAFELCAERRVVCFAHLRSGLEGLQEVIADVLVTGASFHLVHVNSTSGAVTGSPTAGLYLRTIHAARSRGMDISTEAYPYTAGSTSIQSAIFDRVLDTPNADFSRLIWAATGERLTRESFIRYRQTGGTVIQLAGPDSLLYPVFRDSLVMVASDAVPYVNHRGHPRLAGTFARVLGRYVREQHLFTLMEALRRMTIMPARRLEASVPQMRTKGRLGPGMDADIVVFDPARVVDRATIEDPGQYSAGIVHVLVNGIPVVEQEQLVEAFPGTAIRRQSVRQSPDPTPRGH